MNRRIYLDSCVYNRPFDDYHKNEKIFIEALAFYIVLIWVEKGQINLIHYKLTVNICGILEFLTEVIYAKNLEGN